MLNVCHVVVSLAPGGLERLVVDWTNERNRRNRGSTHICCLDEPGGLASEVEGGAVTCIGARRGRFPFDLAAVRHLRNALRGYPVAHSHNLAAQQYTALALAGLRRGHVHTEHGSNPHVSGLVNRLRLRWLAARTDRLVSVSVATQSQLMAAWGGARRKASIVLNGVAIPLATLRSGAELRRDLGIPADARVIGSIGRLAAIKGQDRLVRIFSSLVKQEPLAHLLLVGDGPLRAQLEPLASASGLAGRIHFAGYRPDARELLAAMDVFVLPSRSEGLSVALLEAMAAGIPAAVTRAGESETVIDGGAAGMLLDDDESRWVEPLKALLGDAALRSRLGDAALARVRTSYSLDATLDAYERLYKEAVTVSGEAQ